MIKVSTSRIQRQQRESTCHAVYRRLAKNRLPVEAHLLTMDTGFLPRGRPGWQIIFLDDKTDVPGVKRIHLARQFQRSPPTC